ncbi:MAG: glycosyltransferase [Desulfurivibrionaceae bacterium]
MDKIKILAIAKLHHAFANHYQPLAQCDRVAELTALRPLKWSKKKLSHIEVVDFERFPLVISLLMMFFAGIYLALKRKYDAIVTFTPIPYGVLGLLVSKISRTPLHVGVIGENVQEQLRGWQGFVAKQVLKNAKTISVTGPNTRELLIRHDFDPAALFILPHGVTDDFYPDFESEKIYDAVFIGDLLPVKRVDFIINVWSQVVAASPGRRLCIVGDGKERDKLEDLVFSLGLSKYVEFAGYRQNVSVYLRQTQLLIMASESEGLPFVLIEAMACGVVPVVNDVGDISTLVKEHHNGLLLKKNASTSDYSKSIVKLLEDKQTLKSLQTGALQSVEHLTYKEVTKAWDLILDKLID